MNITNIGTNFLAYVPFAMILVLMVIGYFLVKTGWKFAKAEEEADLPESVKAMLRKSFIRKLIAFAIVLVFAVFSMFFAYGSGKRVTTANYLESGWMKRTADLPDEKSIEVIQKEGEANKDRTGTLPSVANEKSFQEEGVDVDEAIEEILKRSETNN